MRVSDISLPALLLITDTSHATHVYAHIQVPIPRWARGQEQKKEEEKEEGGKGKEKKEKTLEELAAEAVAREAMGACARLCAIVEVAVVVVVLCLSLFLPYGWVRTL